MITDFYDNSEADVKIWKLKCGGRIIADESDGTIEFVPWNSHQDGDIFSTADDRLTIKPEDEPRAATIFAYLASMSEHFQIGAHNPPEPSEPEPEQLEPESSPAIIAGPGATPELNTFALK